MASKALRLCLVEIHSVSVATSVFDETLLASTFEPTFPTHIYLLQPSRGRERSRISWWSRSRRSRRCGCRHQICVLLYAPSPKQRSSDDICTRSSRCCPDGQQQCYANFKHSYHDQFLLLHRQLPKVVCSGAPGPWKALIGDAFIYHTVMCSIK